MAAHRYWRINGLTIGGGAYLEISELQLYAAHVSLNSLATITSSSAPDVFGALADLVDGSLGTRCIWNKATAEAGGFWVKWDFGAGNDKDVTGVKQGGHSDSGRYMSAFSLQWSDDNAAWTTLGSKSGQTYPGNNTLSGEYLMTALAASHRYWRFNGVVVGAGGTFLQLAELQFLAQHADVTNFNTTKTSSDVPDVGTSLAQAFDTGVLTTYAQWVKAVAEGAGFWVKVDFGSGFAMDVTGVKFARTNTAGNYPASFTLQYSDDNAAWTALFSRSSLADPGNQTLSAEYEELVVGDPLYTAVRIALKGNGANGGTVFTDNSSDAHAFSVVGSGVTTSTTGPKNGTAAIDFNGSGHIEAAVGSELDIGLQDFTVECYVWFNADGTYVLMGDIANNGKGKWGFYYDTVNNVLKFSGGESSGPLYSVQSGSWEPVINTWYHVAYSRASFVGRFFVDGVQRGPNVSDHNSWSFTGNGKFRLGGSFNNDMRLNGKIDDARVTLGFARYTTDFAPPGEIIVVPPSTPGSGLSASRQYAVSRAMGALGLR